MLQQRGITTAQGSWDGHEGAAADVTRPCPTDPAGRQVGHAATADSGGRFVDAGVVQIQSLGAGAREVGKGNHGVLLTVGSAWVVPERRGAPDLGIGETERHWDAVQRGRGGVKDTQTDIAPVGSAPGRGSMGPGNGRGRHRGRVPPSECRPASATVSGRSEACHPRAGADSRRLSGGTAGVFSGGGRRTMRIVVTARAPGSGRVYAVGGSARSRIRTR